MAALPEELQKLLPLDKSWMIRMGMLDLQAGSTTAREYLKAHEPELGDDLRALLSVLQSWGTSTTLDVGESGTLYRFLQFYLWLTKSDVRIVTHGTLKNRTLTSDPKITEYAIPQLLTLDGNTSQWASAAYLFTDVQIPKDCGIPYKLQTTIEAKANWAKQQQAGEVWKPRTDITIQRQTEAYFTYLKTGTTDFTPQQAEDFPFACAFGLISPEEGELRWPALRNHESDRIAEMQQLVTANTIDSPDHRIVQALAMRYPDRVVTERSRTAVNKTWPQFWDFLKQLQDSLNS
ncbi:hypothetical protein KBD20_01020 [Candidatus Saccharibacteria bacterium]|nr:hypothetical protein [Candidatus Saccharibacteria bacterium]